MENQVDNRLVWSDLYEKSYDYVIDRIGEMDLKTIKSKLENIKYVIALGIDDNTDTEREEMYGIKEIRTVFNSVEVEHAISAMSDRLKKLEQIEQKQQEHDQLQLRLKNARKLANECRVGMLATTVN